MDPLSQAVVGAAAAGISRHRVRERMPDMLWAGALGGMAPDLDVLIRSGTDPLLSLEYHRHFTHALIMSPVVGFLVGWLLWRIYRAVGRHTPKRDLIMAAIAGAATHGLLDVLTSYGTLLFWPFTNTRFATDWMSIIDIAFTLPLLVGCLWAGRARSVKPLYITSAYALVYIGVMAVYHSIGVRAQNELIAERGSTAVHQRLMPGMFNPLSYRSAYHDGEDIYLDTVKLSWRGAATWRTGKAVPLVTAAHYAKMAQPESLLAHDLKRFHWFADGFVGPMPGNPRQLADYRYFDGATLQPFWGIELPHDRESHVQRLQFRELKTLLNEKRP